MYWAAVPISGSAEYLRNYSGMLVGDIVSEFVLERYLEPVA